MHQKEKVLLYVLIIIGIWILYKSLYVPMDKHIQISLCQSKDALKHLAKPNSCLKDGSVSIDTLHFPPSHTLEHARLGKLGYKKNFFLEANSSFTIDTPTEYTFEISSDDGFALYIDGQIICKYTRPRSFKTSVCTIKLIEGNHTLGLSYFQTSGQTGLEGIYGLSESQERYYIGEDGAGVHFGVRE